MSGGLPKRTPAASQAMNHPAPLLDRTVCPHCWAEFPVEDVLWISSHPALLGDPKLGPTQQLRFLPTRFTVDGLALDSRGVACQHLACPNCYLAVPRASLEMETVFFSIFGEQGCGKSYFLATMAWELRRLLPRQFGLAFADADPIINRVLNEYENQLFLNPRANAIVPLGELIPKTAAYGELLDAVADGDHRVHYPRPFAFSLSPRENHPRYRYRDRLAHLLCTYDNAGDRFHPGEDSASQPDTLHVMRSRFLFFLFDPTQDPRFAALVNKDRPRADRVLPLRSSRQDIILQEVAGQIRRHTGLYEPETHKRRLTVVVTKFDLWRHLIKKPDLLEPWLHVGELVGLDLDRIESISHEVRELLESVCPELVTAAESFAPSVTYIPVSAWEDPP